MRSIGLLFVGCAVLACTAEPDTNTISEDLLELTIAAGDSIDLNAVMDAPRAVIVTVDCGVPANPDLTSALIAVNGASFSAGALDGATRAGFWRWAGTLAEGEHVLSVANQGDKQAKCQIYMQAQPDDAAACTSWTAHRSVVKSAVHLPVGNTEDGEWETLPASGNHWGAWAMWGHVYDKPVLPGFYLHNLEHGGLVLSYRCESADESDECAAAEERLIALAEQFGQSRLLVTPDPEQPTMFAVRSWRMAYASDCFDEASALSFMEDNYRRGREDIDADPPIPFDPTTTDDVPCENLMAAPDGC